jgi:Fur family ferric uptake transcriptional regulator
MMLFSKLYCKFVAIIVIIAVMNSSQAQLSQHLKQQGFSLTEARTVVFDALRNKEPQTMQQLVSACPLIDRASVYRAVALFEKLGISHRLQIGWKYKLELTDVFSPHHHHMTCLKCGKVIPFDEDQRLENSLVELASSKKFKMQGHQLEIQGFCAACQK